MRRAFVVYELPMVVGVLLFVVAVGLPILTAIRHGRLSPVAGVALLLGSCVLAYLLVLGSARLSDRISRREEREAGRRGTDGT